jgi:hypothetical protein
MTLLGSARLVGPLGAGALLALLPATALPIDGIAITGEATYYEGVVGPSAPSALESPAAGTPAALHVSDSIATVEYASAPAADGRLEWTAKVRGLARSHERIDAVYHVMAIVPLPVDGQGRIIARPIHWGLGPREGTPEASVPLIYAGEKVVLKRSHSLERTLLPQIVGSGSEKLPSLAGTGYGYSVWDTIVRYDPGYGDEFQLFADLQYTTEASVSPPDAADERLKAYVVTWIPSLDPSIAPFAIRLDVRTPE